MKKIGLFLFLLTGPVLAQAAYQEVYSLGKASFTQTNDGPVFISSHGGVLMGVIIDSPSALGTLTLADAYISTGGGNTVTYATFSILSLGAGNAPSALPTFIPYNINLSSGLSYTTANNAGGVTIIWKPFVTPSSGK